MRLSFHCPISLKEYIELPRADRLSLQHSLTEWIIETSEESTTTTGEYETNAVASPSPRTMRRVGL